MAAKTTKARTFEELVTLVQQWAKERGIGSNSTAQLQKKTSEEIAELQAAHGVIDFLRRHADKAETPDETYLFHQLTQIAKHERDDAVGDSLVTIIIHCMGENTDIVACLDQAYEEIKNRKGKEVAGVFVRDK